MKYIRTKDKIIGYEKIFETGEYLSQINIDGKIYDKFDWAVQGDTIVELCDAIVETKGTFDYYHYYYTAFNVPSKKRLIDDMINQDFEIYGAIWTDKGLIYVAKMNEGGKLCLL